MSSKSTQAWLLHKLRSGESSLKASFFTYDFGRITCIIKGGRNLKKQAIVQEFTPLWLNITNFNGYYYVQKLENEEASLCLSGPALFSALYINELIYYLLKSQAAEKNLFQAYGQTLYNLTNAKDNTSIEIFLRRFEWALIKACGQALQLDYDQHGQKILANNNYQFKVDEGFTATLQGISGADLLALSADNLNNDSYRKTAKIIMRKIINHLLDGRELKSRGLFRNHYE